MPARTCGVSNRHLRAGNRASPAAAHANQEERRGRSASPRSTSLRTSAGARATVNALCRLNARIATRRPENWPAICVQVACSRICPEMAPGCGTSDALARELCARSRSPDSRRRHGYLVAVADAAAKRPPSPRSVLCRSKTQGNSRRRDRRTASPPRLRRPAGAVLHPSGGRERGGSPRAARRVASAGGREMRVAPSSPEPRTPCRNHHRPTDS
jgi:hypothetical protein